MDAKTVLSAISVLLALIGGLGIAYAVFRSATITKTMELYKLENEALGKSVARLQAEQITQAERIATLEEENRVLKDMVTGASAIKSLTDYARTEAELRREEHVAQVTLSKDILGQLKDIWRSIQPAGRLPGTGEIGRA